MFFRNVEVDDKPEENISDLDVPTELNFLISRHPVDFVSYYKLYNIHIYMRYYIIS